MTTATSQDAREALRRLDVRDAEQRRVMADAAEELGMALVAGLLRGVVVDLCDDDPEGGDAGCFFVSRSPGGFYYQWTPGVLKHQGEYDDGLASFLNPSDDLARAARICACTVELWHRSHGRAADSAFALENDVIVGVTVWAAVGDEAPVARHGAARDVSRHQ